MALKRVLESVDELSDDVKKEYVKKEDGKFHLDVDGEAEELNHLRTKKSIAEEHRTKAEKQRDDLAAELENIRKGAIPKGDVEALENSYKGKMIDAEAKHKERETKLVKQLHRATVGAQAEQIAAELFVAPHLLHAEVAKRLTVEETEDGELRIRVKGADGKPSALTIEDLKTELRSDKRYETVLIGSKGTGSGANGANGRGNGGGNSSGKKPHEMTESERNEFFKRDPEGFKRAFGQVA